MKCSWISQALTDLVAEVSSLYSTCHELQKRQPLVAIAICQLCANLATRLQHLAINAEAPEMQEGRAAEVRSLCGRLCVKLRDLFMP